MKDDTISRAAVLDEIHKYMGERDYTIGTLYDNICEMPSAQQWIPYDCCEEVGCIPSYGERVLITYKDDDGTQEVLQAIWIQPFITNDGYMLDSEVTAFMPFPEPYKEGEK